MLIGDTIAAVSTPPGRGGIGVIRVSGERALALAQSLFQSASQQPAGTPNRAQFGRLIHPTTREPIDEVILIYFKAPHSYTGEDVVEISCHGSPVILRLVLDLLLTGGARLAEPGEFTLRAVINNRLDLAQAQAVRDLINAQTEYQTRLATRQLEGALAKRLRPIKDALVAIVVQLESALEFVEDDISPENLAQLIVKLNQVRGSLQELAASFAFGRYVKEGFDLAIIGRPNVGKSSVFNRLIGVDRAIVTPLPGTTRDALYESAAIRGLPVRLIDTAGIRETGDPIERLGIERSRTAIADADIRLLILDASEPTTEDDLRLLDQVSAESRLIVLNKTDLPRELTSDSETVAKAIGISALTGAGFDELQAAILHQLSGGEAGERDDLMITDARQAQAIRDTNAQLEAASELLIAGEFEEVILLKLRGALTTLGEITGETLTDDILNQIFSTFCIGK